MQAHFVHEMRVYAMYGANLKLVKNGRVSNHISGEIRQLWVS